MAFAAGTVAAVCFGASWSVAIAQSTSTTNASATPASPFTTANPAGIFQANPPLAASAAQIPALTYGVGEVVKLYQGGINKDIIVNYINNNALPYHLSADGVLYLQSFGNAAGNYHSIDPARRPVAAATGPPAVLSTAEATAGKHAAPRWRYGGPTTYGGYDSHNTSAGRHGDRFGLSGL